MRKIFRSGTEKAAHYVNISLNVFSLEDFELVFSSALLKATTAARNDIKERDIGYLYK